MPIARFLNALAAIAAAALLALGTAANAQQARVELVKVHGSTLEGNLEGNDADRDVYVILPPGYDEHADKRYPVVYFLHGIASHAKDYLERIDVADAVQQAAAAGNELILVLPDSYTKQSGSLYSNSPTVGDFEDFIAGDLVDYVDSHYRTIANRDSRGLSGHSMGGYGTLRVGMKHPEVFSSLFAMSPCCLDPREITPEAVAKMAAASGDGPFERDDQLNLAAFAAWSPDPTNPPHYIYTGLKDGRLDEVVTGRIWGNAPIVMVSQFVPALKRMEAIAIEAGDKDPIAAPSEQMHQELDRFGIANSFEEFDGDHTNRMKERFRSKLLPFFDEHLDRAKPER